MVLSRGMGALALALPVVYTTHHHQLLGNKVVVTHVRMTAGTRATVSPAARIQSSFVGSRQSVRRLSLFQTTSTSYSSHICRSQVVQEFVPTASAGYALLLLGGGLFGYTKSGSKGSLFGGLTGATLMYIAYYLMQSSETKEVGDALAFGASLLFAAIFGMRFAATRKLIPAGLLLGFSISLMAATLLAYVQDKI